MQRNVHFLSPTRSQSSQDNGEVLVNVIVKQDADGRVVATVLGLPEIRVEASDRAAALAQLQQRLETHLADTEIISLSVKMPSTEKKNPWLAMAGVFKDDPQFEQMLEAIENYRRELDKSTEDTFDKE
jgi:predicted RNase H-like HicB family nuclease